MKKKKKQNQQPKKKIDWVTLRKIIFTLMYILILVLCYFSASKNYLELNFLQQFLGGPLIVIYSKLFEFNTALAFISAFTVGAIIFFPLVQKSFISMINFGKEFKNIMAIHKDESLSSEKRVNKMIDLMEEKDASLFAPFANIFYSFIWTFTTAGLFQIFFNLDSVKFLWFDLMTNDHLYILPSLITLCVIPRIVKNIKSLFHYEGKMKLFLDISLLVTKVLLIVGCFTSSLTCVIFVILILYYLLRKSLKNIKERQK